AHDDSDYIALVWRAEAAMHLGDPDTAHDLLSKATMCAPGFLFVAWMIRFLVVAEEERGDEPVVPHRTEEFRAAVEEIVPEAREAFRRRDREMLKAAVRAALARMGGNRT